MPVEVAIESLSMHINRHAASGGASNVHGENGRESRQVLGAVCDVSIGCRMGYSIAHALDCLLGRKVGFRTQPHARTRLSSTASRFIISLDISAE
jgi:hypothetical protein